jgi:hypothetical protein
MKRGARHPVLTGEWLMMSGDVVSSIQGVFGGDN